MRFISKNTTRAVFEKKGIMLHLTPGGKSNGFSALF